MKSDNYINRYAVLNVIDDAIAHNALSYEGCVNTIMEFIAKIPAADVREVVRGRWIGYPECLKYTNAYSDDHIICSACEECFSILDNDCERFNFCPNCGADMTENET